MYCENKHIVKHISAWGSASKKGDVCKVNWVYANHMTTYLVDIERVRIEEKI